MGYGPTGSSRRRLHRSWWWPREVGDEGGLVRLRRASQAVSEALRALGSHGGCLGTGKTRSDMQVLRGNCGWGRGCSGDPKAQV